VNCRRSSRAQLEQTAFAIKCASRFGSGEGFEASQRFCGEFGFQVGRWASSWRSRVLASTLYLQQLLAQWTDDFVMHARLAAPSSERTPLPHSTWRLDML
jgi:hypothetical protein